MFQYAMARRLAHAHNTCVKLDLSFLNSRQKGYELRKYELNIFNITAEVARPLEIALITGKGRNPIENAFACFLHKTGLSTLSPNTYQEISYKFDPAVLNLTDNSYLEGYWQSERYFCDISDIIHQEFTVKQPMEGMNRELAELISGCESVSLHVRRGDYVANPRSLEFHGICNLSYYRKCIAAIVQKVQSPHFFVFSDDPNWAINNIKIEYPTKFITHNGPDKGCDDMRLMSLCRHFILANSSFSWWGAWLNSYPHKLVYAPEKWFNSSDLNTIDLLPKKWITMGSDQ